MITTLLDTPYQFQCYNTAADFSVMVFLEMGSDKKLSLAPVQTLYLLIT